MGKLSFRNLNVAGKRVLVRVDFNVPLAEKDGRQVITDDTRVSESLPTLKFLLENKAKLVLMSHLGRPKGKVKPEFSLAPVAERLRDLLSVSVKFAPDCIGPDVEKMAEALQPGEVLLLENLRFHPEEEANDLGFSKALARLGELYVNDAFGTAHRAHASTAGVVAFMEKAAMGALLEKELHYLNEGLKTPERPFLVILGGAKVSDKIAVIKSLMEKADIFLIGGAMANTFAKAQGVPMGDSLVENDRLELALEILKLAKEKGIQFLLPVDSIETKEIKPGAETRNTPPLSPSSGIAEGWKSVDIGSETIKRYCEALNSAKTVLWNGPMGIFEIEDFARGTFAMAESLAASSAVTIIGGGDSVTAVKKAGLADKMTFISTGGGASLELLEGKELPGVSALSESN